MKRYAALTCLLALSLTGDVPADEPQFRVAGTLEDRDLVEASGLQAGAGEVYYVHNDGKRDVFVIDATGRAVGRFKLDGSKNKDWEDISRVPHEEGHLLLIADVGDNHRRRKDVELYFFAEPGPDDYNRDHEAMHRLKLSYPDGPRDVESVAYDPSSRSILLLSKRDLPPRLYGVALDRALSEEELEAEFLAEVPGFRPPTTKDVLTNPKRGLWVSQPTGMDISPDGRLAAVITYRSLYLFQREEGESWAEAFQRKPREFVGPPGTHDEAVAFTLDGKTVLITTERRPAPVYRLELPEPQKP
jgi:hypothetical protein